ncbi:MAG: SRPBCC family protein [Bauldia sp.]|nr:SRPBCC family protein [Bauldia sp.]MCW5719291.1 SRPBCC family protein [Bauldia sp.]
MTNRSVTFATFALHRVYPAKPERVYRAFADPVAKARWFSQPEGYTITEQSLDFRVGGMEVTNGTFANGPSIEFLAHYQDIVPSERIIYSYAMKMDGNRISVSVATLEFTPEGAGTKLTVTEQGAFLDGFDDPRERERGTIELLDAIGRDIAAHP